MAQHPKRFVTFVCLLLSATFDDDDEEEEAEDARPASTTKALAAKYGMDEEGEDSGLNDEHNSSG